MGSATSTEILDIPYLTTENERQCVDLFLPSKGDSSNRPLAIFIHGGAWVSEQRQDHRETARRLSKDSSIAVAVVDYRISVKPHGKDSPEVFHPAHLQDVFAALRYLVLERQGRKNEYSVDNVHVFGHSVGAFMTAAACLSTRGNGSDSSMPELDEEVRRSVRSWILVDGIFSLLPLLEEYPSYTSFVSQAFNSPTGSEFPTPLSISTQKLLSDSSIESWSLPSSSNKPAYYSHKLGKGRLPHVYILHSRDDELLTFRQSLAGIKRLVTLTGSSEKETQPVEFPKDGIASVSEEEQSKVRTPPFVKVDFVSLRGSHAEQIQTSDFTKLIASIIKQESSS